jgi:phage FluMu gp28-like protein
MTFSFVIFKPNLICSSHAGMDNKNLQMIQEASLIGWG